MNISGKIVGREMCDNNLYAYRVLIDGVVSDPDSEVLPMGSGATFVIPDGTTISVEVRDPKTFGQRAFEVAAKVLNKKVQWDDLPDESKAVWESAVEEQAAVASAKLAADSAEAVMGKVSL